MGRLLGAGLLGALLLGAMPAAAQSFDGVWQGRIRCEAAGSLGALNAPIKVTIAGNRASYEREIRSTSDRSQVLATETGSGTVAADGTVRMNGTVGAATWRQDSNFTGRMQRPTTTLGGGITTFSRQNNAGVERRCTATITPG
ncbi:MAG: hypothetical protein IT556_03370 [Acetobacteraceae bacterium]|nr:hypothetical protein [Acetobacteraceae bacterium]